MPLEPTTISVTQAFLDTISSVYYACKQCGTYCLPGELGAVDDDLPGELGEDEYLCLDCKANQA